MIERILHFAHNAVRVAWGGARAASIVEHLFSRLSHESETRPCANLSIHETGDQLIVSEDGRELLRTASEGQAAECLLGQAVYHLVDHSQGGLVLHAAAVALDTERALVMPGTSGAGKTTLTAWLVKHGHDYLTDEAVFVPLETTHVESLCRPLNLKVGSRPALLQLSPKPEGVLRFAEGDLVDPGALRSHTPRTEAELGLFLFPTFSRGQPLAITPLSPAQATQALLSHAANARSVPRHGLGEAARLARAVPAYTLSYGDYADLPELARWLSERS